MANKIDLTKLKQEIDKSKKESQAKATPLNNASISPRDAFLHGLVESLHSGRETISTTLVKHVDNKTAEKKQEKARLPISQTAPSLTENVPPVAQPPSTVGVDREAQMYADFEKMKRQTLAESINQYTGQQQTNMPPVVNYNGQQLLTSIPQQQVPTGNINEGVLVESVKEIVNNHLIESLSPILEDTIKGTIIEIFAQERIKEVIEENKEMIKDIVYETIRELQRRKKK